MPMVSNNEELVQLEPTYNNEWIQSELRTENKN